MFELTSLDARRVASLTRRHFLRQHFKVETDRPAWPDAPYRTSLLCRRRSELKLIECQARLDYHHALKSFHHYLFEHRLPAELYISVATSDEVTISATALKETDQDGVGLILIDGRGQVTVSKKACDWAYFAAPDPTLKFGSLRALVEAAFVKYNRVDRVDGMRDLSNMVEGETRRLARVARTKGWFGSKAIDLDAKDWNGVINLLGSHDASLPGLGPVINEGFKNDLHSFRGGRNLVDHPAPSTTAAERIARQFQDRMVLGARLVADLDARRRSVAQRLSGPKGTS